MWLIFFLFGGGIVLALASLIVASRTASPFARIFFAASAVLALLAQSGCWIGAAGVGRSTGASGGGGAFVATLFISAIIAVAWIVLIFEKPKNKKNKNEE